MATRAAANSFFVFLYLFVCFLRKVLKSFGGKIRKLKKKKKKKKGSSRHLYYHLGNRKQTFFEGGPTRILQSLWAII